MALSLGGLLGGLNSKTALLQVVAGALGISPKHLSARFMEERMKPHIPEIIAEMKRIGRTFDKMPEAKVVDDAIKKLWRAALPVAFVADAIAAAHDVKVEKIVDSSITPSTTLEEALPVIMHATVELMF